ncbi:MAG TPA: ParB/RepB/Spo0J family partition protein [Chitinivibrionales bacterium]|nr:ParB/RepB/Spo0J family partition protein [Chitinivibrionales bacterium]
MGNAHHRRALGRGLTNLIPQESEEKGSGNEIVLVDSNAIRPNPFQPRREFDQKEIEGLAESIKTQGLLQAIILRRNLDGYEIISGERRYRALLLLGEDKIPSIIKPKVSDHEMIEIALVENIQRENLNDIEEAGAYQRLLSECGLSHEQLSARVGKSRSAITNILRLLKLPQEIQQMIIHSDITSGHARALLGLEDPDGQKALCQRIVAQKLSVRDVEEAVQHGKAKKAEKGSVKKKAGATKDPDHHALIEKLQYKFGTKVTFTNLRNDKGKIEIHYYNKDDLNRIIEILSKE